MVHDKLHEASWRFPAFHFRSPAARFDLAVAGRGQVASKLIRENAGINMRAEANQKCTAIALGWAVGGSMLALGIGWVWAAATREQFWTSTGGLLVVLVAGLVVTSLKLALARAGCEVAEAGVLIHRPFGTCAILYPSITRVDRVSRVGSDRNEKVRITFRKGGSRQFVIVRAANPEFLAAEIVARCPHLKSGSARRTTRDRSFGAAEKSLWSGNRGPAPEPWH
jgi:hypothetical protein